MKEQRLLALILALCLASASFGQRPDSPQSQKPPDGDVVRITTNLVQIDAVITDKNGKPITDLKPDELQLFEDKRERKITHFSYIAADPAPHSQRSLIPATTNCPAFLQNDCARRTYEYSASR